MEATTTCTPHVLTHDPRAKSPALAIILSALPGLGQVYVGYTTQGFINITVVATLIALLDGRIGPLEPLLGMFLEFFWLYNMVDAGRRAAFVNHSLAGMAPSELPSGFGARNQEGTLLGGITLILLGFLALAHVTFGLSLAWIERWWPLGLVIVGGYLVFRTLPARPKADPEAEAE